MPIYSEADFESGIWRSFFDFGDYRSCDTPLHIDFLHALSNAILRHPRSPNYSDLMTVGYYCRKAETKRSLQKLTDPDKRFGLGTALHIAPSNIPINFAFSLIMGFLSGNSNIVRLPTRIFEQMELFIQLFDVVSALPKFNSLAGKTVFVQTQRDSQSLRSLVAEVQALVVWGGDATVETFRGYRKSSRCVDVYFPNRVSSALLSAKACIGADSRAMESLANAFFNDSYFVDQNACSSPSILFWIGSDHQCRSASKLFWAAVNKRLMSGYSLDPVARIDRSLDMLKVVAEQDGPVELNQLQENIWLLKNEFLRNTSFRFGTFLEINCLSIDEVAPYLRQNEQTLAIFGVPSVTVFAALKSQKAIVDRIVPIGQALNIGMHWDGREMLCHLSRKVEVA
jgi:hypothetical protein